jgi:hypothetical protein
LNEDARGRRGPIAITCWMACSLPSDCQQQAAVAHDRRRQVVEF